MNKRNTYVLTQYREGNKYRNFLGHLYHFPKSYVNSFKEFPIEFVFYEPIKNGKGEFFGCGEVHGVVPDNESEENYFALIKNYQNFEHPVFYRNKDGGLIEGESPHYNSQNAVRKIPSKLFDEIILEGGIKLNFKSDSHLIKVLGEQLIGSEKVGILELIKNAIDAQATYCRIRIEKIDDLRKLADTEYEFNDYDGPVIVVEDDGQGMTKDILENGWLRPASTIKTNIKERIKRERERARETGILGTYDALINQLKKEHGNRIPLGEKGVGRFATHRLGKFLELRTKVKQNPYELVLKIEWDKFDIISDKRVDLDSIGISITKQNPSRDYKSRDSGTQLIIYGGRDGFKWDEDSILDLNRAILSLNSPNLNRNFNRKSSYETFNAFLECPQIDDLPKTQVYEESEPNFSLDVLINENGIADYSLSFKHPYDRIPPDSWNESNKDLRILDQKNRHFWGADGIKRKPECGSFFIHMDVWYRRSEWIDLPNWKDLAEYLGEFGGMSIYRDNILIFDAKLGAELDWLKLTEKRIGQAFRISYRDFIGSIEIEQQENIYLVDKTNREGLINNQAYTDLAVLTRNAIETFLLPRYIAKRNDYTNLTRGIITDPEKLKQISQTNAKLLSNISRSSYPFDDDPYTFFAGLWEKVDERKDGLVNLEGSIKELQKSIEMLEEVQNQFIEQAGFGIAVAISLHEINKITTNFYHSILHLVKSEQLNKLELETLKETSQSLRTELKRLGPLRAIRNENRVEFDIERSIKYASEVFKRPLKAKNIELEVIIPEGGFMIYGRYGALNQVFGNLFDNSIYWIENFNKSENKITIKVDKKHRSVIFADSGEDIDEIIRPYLFQPGYSLKIPKSGLGLYICKTYLDLMKARIYETPLRDRMSGVSGAHFTLDFSRTPVNKDKV